MLFSKFDVAEPIMSDKPAKIPINGLVYSMKETKQWVIRLYREQIISNGGISVKKPHTGKTPFETKPINQLWNGTIPIMNIKFAKISKTDKFEIMFLLAGDV